MPRIWLDAKRFFKVKVKGIETRKLRELDDEFAQEVSQFDTMEEFRQDLRTNLEQMLESRKKELIKQEVLDRALEASEILLAEAVILGQVEAMMEQFGQRLASQGLTLEQYFEFTGSSWEDLQSDMRPEAERTAKINFLLEKIVEEKGIEVTDEEMNKQIEEAAKGMGVDPEQAKQNLAGIMDRLEFSVKMDKAVQYLIDHAQIEEFETETNEEEDETSGDD